jgi:ParB-like nuclease domain
MSDPKVYQSAGPAVNSVPSPVANGRWSSAAGDSNRRLEMMPPGSLIADRRNARTHAPRQIGQIACSIERFGFISPVLIDDANQIIAGHGRVEAAKWLGLDYVPVLRVSHLSAAERKAYALADNRLAELAGWDREILATELQALIDLNFEIELTGFDVGEVDIIRNDADADRGESADPSGAVAAPISGPTVSQAGDVWLLGEHQLRCRDGGNADSYAAVDAAIRRWQRVTGKSAMLAGVGKTFAEIKNERASTDLPDPACRQAAPNEGAA